MNVVSNVIVFYVVFFAKKYMSSFLTFQICDRITNYGYVFQYFYYELWLCVSTQSNVGNVYSYYVAYDVQYLEYLCETLLGSTKSNSYLFRRKSFSYSFPSILNLYQGSIHPIL